MSITWRGQRVSVPYKVDAGNMCTHCMSDIFNHSLYHDLISAKTKASVELVYTQPGFDLYKSIRVQCPWCLAIALTIRDVLFHIDSMSSEDDDVDTEPCWSPMTIFRCEAVIKTTVQFYQRHSRMTFNAVKIQIEVINTKSEDCGLPELIGDDSIILDFEVSSNARELQLFQRHWGRISADSNDWLAPALNWLELCDSHNHCKTDGIFYPSRFIDVTDPCRPRLITRGEIQTCSEFCYATLSYVWGPTQIYFLTITNQGRLRLGLDLALLPKTLKDAILVASQLGFKYIWIDALCIIQDSPDDKAVEVSQMATIYRNSALTIFAASATCSGEGFLNPPEGITHSFTPIEILLNAGDNQQCSILLGSTLDMDARAHPINNRAWTLQEELLSPRLLRFEHGGVSWECIESRITYRGPVAREEVSFLSLCTAAKKTGGDSIYLRWSQIRYNYCGRSLSFLDDKLDALSAVASEISRKTGWTYLAGLWKEHLIEDLLWSYQKLPVFGKPEIEPNEHPTLKSARARAAKRIAPSWSWASVVEGQISDTDFGQVRQPFQFEVLDCRLEAAGTAPFGAVKSGFLEVKGKIANLRFRHDSRPDMMSNADKAFLGNTPTVLLEPNLVVIVGYGVFDPVDLPLPPDTRLHCLAVGKQTVFDNEVIEGLMLLPDGNSAFRRIGFFRLHQHDVFQSVPRQVLRIV